MPSHPDAPVTAEATAPPRLEYNGKKYIRLGKKRMLYISKFHVDVRGFWLLASLYQDVETNNIVELTCDGHITPSDFQKIYYGRIFKDYKQNEVITNFQKHVVTSKISWDTLRYGTLVETMIYNRLKFLGLKYKKIHKKGNDILRFTSSEDYAQFRLYFSEYFA